MLDTKTTDLLEVIVKIREHRFTAAILENGRQRLPRRNLTPISKYFCNYVLCICAKCHAYIIKRTINAHIGWNISTSYYTGTNEYMYMHMYMTKISCMI